MRNCLECKHGDDYLFICFRDERPKGAPFHWPAFFDGDRCDDWERAMANDDYESVDLCGKSQRGPFDLDVGQYQELGEIHRRWEKALMRDIYRDTLKAGCRAVESRHEAFLWGMPA